MIKRASIQGAHPPSRIKFPDISLTKIYFFLTFFQLLNGLLLPYSRLIFTNSDSNKSNVKNEQFFQSFLLLESLKVAI